MKLFVNNFLLSIGFTSLGFYEMFSNISLFCAKALPITGVLSFFIYVLINMEKIFTAIYNILTRIKKTFGK